ncbi:MAG: hypothetical protein C0483_14620 [Pirellula sp.]|nr:hypothetical protein [Pirellula sp.]
MDAIETALKGLVEGRHPAELTMLRMTAHLGPMRGSESFALLSDGSAKSWAFVPSKGIGKQDPHKLVGTVDAATLAEVAGLLLAIGVQQPPADPPPPGGAEVEFGVSVGDAKSSLRKASFAIKNDPAWLAVHAKFEALKKSFVT